MKTITLDQAQWDVVTQALLDAPMPLRQSGPVFQAIVEQLRLSGNEAVAGEAGTDAGGAGRANGKAHGGAPA